MKKSTKSGLLVLILLLICVAGYVCYLVWDMNKDDTSVTTKASGSYRVAEDSSSYDPTAAKSYKRNFIAALYIEGTISEANQSYNQKWLMDTIASLKKNEKNDALAIFINSPGGAVYQADELYLALTDFLCILLLLLRFFLLFPHSILCPKILDSYMQISYFQIFEISSNYSFLLDIP